MKSYNDMMELTKSGLIPFLIGPRGEGKSQYVKDFSKSLGLENDLWVLNLSCIESTDFTGLPYIENHITKYARPSFLTAKVLFLDETDRVRDSSVRAALLTLLLDRQINGHRLEADCIIICAGNGKYDADETIELSGAYKDRFIEIDFKYTDEEKIEYLRKKYQGNNFLKFLEVKPELLNTFSTRRIEAFLKVDNRFCADFLGTETARLFRHFIESNLVTLEDIKKGTYDFNGMSAITKSSLVIDIVSAFYSIAAADSKNVNKFINMLKAEEKANYFSRLKKLCLENPEKFQKKAAELNAADMFKGQKEYLTELTK